MEYETRLIYVDSGGTLDVSGAMSDTGFSTTVVGSAAGCLARLSTAACVVIAGALPDTSCVDLCTQIRDRRPEVPIVVFPENGSETLAGEVIAAGADGYIPRSQGVETLVTRVDDLLADAESVPAESEPPPTRLAASERNGDPDFIPDSSASGASRDETTPESGGSLADPIDRLDLVIDQSPLAIIEWTLEFEVCSWNPAATELFGYTAEAAMGESGMSLLVPDARRDDVADHWETLVDGDLDETAKRQVNRNVRQDGTTITCEWFNTPLIDDDGEVVSVLSFAQDVTRDLKRANALEALQRTTHDLMRAESMAEIGDLVVDATDRVIDESLAGLRFYDEDTDSLEIAAMTGQLDEQTDDLPTIGPGDGILWTVYEDQEPSIIDDAAVDMVPYDIATSVGNAIVHPLGEHGLLTVASTGETELDIVDMHLVHVLAATAEAALDRAARERELERTKAIVEAVGDSVYALDRDGRFVSVNDTLTAVTGYDRDELLGEHVSKTLTEDSLEHAGRRVRELVSAGDDSVATYEVTVETSDGERIPSEVNVTLLHSDGDLVGTVGIVRDISDRKRMKRELVDRKAKIESLHEIASRLDDCESEAAVFDLSVEAAEDVLNFDVCLVGRREGEYLVKQAIAPPIDDGEYSDRTHIQEGIAGKTYRNQQTYHIDDIREATDTEDDDPYRSILSVPIGDHGVFQAVSTERGAFDSADEELAELLLSHVTDTLDRLAFEAELTEERDRFFALFENVPDAVVNTRLHDDGPIIEDVNSAFERVFGYDEQEVLGKPLDQFIVPTNRTQTAETLNHHGVSGDPVEAEVKRRTADGLRDFMMRVVPMQIDDESERAFGVYTDITERKQRQKRVEILNRVLRHDLRNGMNIINGCAEMLVDAVDDDDTEYVETIQERASELISLAEKTRAVERTLERSESTIGPIDIADATERATDRLESVYSDVDVSCTIPDRTFVRADEYIQTAIFQVLENAVEHNDAESPTIDVRLSTQRADDAADPTTDDFVTLSITDNGPGIPDEERELLQEEREITQLRHASGLGLWLVNWVVSQSGGQLSFDEYQPRGTVVEIQVPRAETALTQRSAAEPPADN
ncbi:PAS domain S-box protein [Natronorubrum sp. JWXQ-INN-674]|uniref:histidine kinase n=1 Tax=Natronorubrum halalkaliphilum TaxID=2691917 RepID=A0A6B0VP26_9EURY|nr:PAS domain S-box protein [Natronorubrum halalkaliphilum]MXV63571.1 PAS domain S-box protein [Natronorubrum halalkaliphilum]